MSEALTKRQEQGRASRELILDTVERLMASKGYAGTSISNVSAACGLSPSSIYWHFGSKEGLLAAVLARGADRFLDAASHTEDTVGVAESTFAAHMRAFGDLQLEHFQQLRLLYLVNLERSDDFAVATVMRRVRHAAIHRLKNAISSLVPADVPAAKADSVIDELVAIALAISDGILLDDDFADEADLASMLDHPEIVGVRDRGEYDGQLWIAFEHVIGTDAADLLRDGHPDGLPPDQVVQIITAVAEALDHAHDRGVLHGGVGPRRIITASGGRTARIMLTDFALSRLSYGGAGQMSPESVAYTAAVLRLAATASQRDSADDVFVLAVQGGSARGEVGDVGTGGSHLGGGQRGLECLGGLEAQIGDHVVRRLTAAEGLTLASGEAHQPRHFQCQRSVSLGVVVVEGGRIGGLAVAH
jgi:AcrR family transcriptional regulator